MAGEQTAIGHPYRNDSVGLRNKIEALISEPFDLAKDYMLRAALVNISDSENILVVTIHHIAADGWSLPIVIKEVAALYSAYDENRPAPLPALTNGPRAAVVSETRWERPASWSARLTVSTSALNSRAC